MIWQNRIRHDNAIFNRMLDLDVMITSFVGMLGCVKSRPWIETIVTSSTTTKDLSIIRGSYVTGIFVFLDSFDCSTFSLTTEFLRPVSRVDTVASVRDPRSEPRDLLVAGSGFSDDEKRLLRPSFD